MAEASKGLRNIVVAQSSICSIDGEQGILMYRGYDIADLAAHATYEEVCYLLLHGELPAAEQLAGFREELAAARPLSSEAARVVDEIANAAEPMEALRTAVSALSFDDPDKDSNAQDANERKAVRLISQLPTAIARYQRRRRGLEPIAPDATLDYSTNFLTMLRGEAPSEHEAHVFDVGMILHADHEMNASTFTARVIAATLSDLHSAVVGAIGALKGPLHGGANEWVASTLERIGTEDGVEPAIQALLDAKEKIPGFGHAVYRTMDPRAVVLKELARELSEDADPSEPNWYAMTERMQSYVHDQKGLWPNVDLYSASVYRYLGIEVDLFTTLFAASRVVGWSAHVIEQHLDNKIIRPASEYVGPEPREFPVASRS
jgi:citrate synthase